MRRYITNHLRYEEELLEKNGYPNLENHKEVHKQFENQLEKYQLAFKPLGDDRNSIAEEVAEFLESWFSGHIRKVDQHYGEFFKGKTLDI